jgi:arylsulfatase A-like enzyme
MYNDRMKSIMIVMDSLNRHYLSCYGASWIRTPNLDRLAARSIVFDNHYAGSLPCMPARREMMTGRHNFLEAPWGPIEPWDECVQPILRDGHGVYSHLITDHYHYFHAGGEGYHTLFDSWEFERGQEGDVWRPVVDLPPIPETRGKGLARGAYWRNRSQMDPQDDLSYPTPRCFDRAVEFLELNHATDNWHLHLEVFDPHEPFDCPDRYLEMYDDTWDRYLYNWPDYAPLDPGLDDEAAVAHIRRRYAGVLTMADHWLGTLIDRMDALDLWDDTQIILTTDHGHLLGEHGYWAKNYMFDYNELARIPLLIARPGQPPGRCRSLTQTIDLAPTLLDTFGAAAPESMRGRSIVPLTRELASGRQPDLHALHDAVLYGYFGKDINLSDGRYTYCRQPRPGSTTYHHTLMPRGFRDFMPRDRLERAEIGSFLPQAGRIPHLRIPSASTRHHNAPDFNPIYDIDQDPSQQRPIRDGSLESELAAKMRTALVAHEAPACQLERTGLE